MGARKWFIGVFVIAAIAIVFLGVKSFLIKEDREQTKLNSALADALARADSLGLPVYAEHLRANPITDEDNLWVELVLTGRQMQESDGEYVGIRDLAKLTDKNAFLLSAPDVLLRWENVLRRVERAVDRPNYVHDREWENGYWVIFPDLAQIKSLAIGLSAKSRYELLTESREASLRTLRAALKLAVHLRSERSVIASLTRVSVEAIVSKEIVLHAQLVKDEPHRAALRKILESLNNTPGIQTSLAEEVVMFVESIRMMSDESQPGNAVRKELNQYLSPVAKAAGSTVSAETARRLEAIAINVACDYYEELSTGFDDHVKNDVLFEKLFDLPYEWVVDKDLELGDLPFGALQIYDFMGGGNPDDRGKAYGALARTELGGELYLLAFKIVVGDEQPAEGASWQSMILSGGELTYTATATGFSLTATAPDVDSITLKFDRPR